MDAMRKQKGGIVFGLCVLFKGVSNRRRYEGGRSVRIHLHSSIKPLKEYEEAGRSVRVLLPVLRIASRYQILRY